jgi:hypothetical protein
VLSCLVPSNPPGVCKNGDKCAFKHDPSRVAVCTRFLRGACDDSSCPYSHSVSADRMPVCSHFLRGACTRENCPYLHVKVSKDAPVCPDFVSGSCPRGASCSMQHVFECPEWIDSGKCSKDKKCGLRHPVKRSRSLVPLKSPTSEPGSDEPPRKRMRFDDDTKAEGDVAMTPQDASGIPLADASHDTPPVRSDSSNPCGPDEPDSSSAVSSGNDSVSATSSDPQTAEDKILLADDPSRGPVKPFGTSIRPTFGKRKSPPD